MPVRLPKILPSAITVGMTGAVSLILAIISGSGASCPVASHPAPAYSLIGYRSHTTRWRALGGMTGYSPEPRSALRGEEVRRVGLTRLERLG